MKKERKNKYFIFGFVFALIILSCICVSAQYELGEGLERGADQLIYTIKRFFSPFIRIFLGGEGELLLERVLLFCILLAGIYVGVSKVPAFSEKSAVIWTITIAVSLLATRFLTETALVQTILLPYSVFGVAVTAAIPLIIYFFFVEEFQSSIIRKMMWIFFLVIFIGLWYIRYPDLGNLSWIYFITGIAALLFLLFDGTIRRIIIEQEYKQLGLADRDAFEAKIRRQMREAKEDLNEDVITQSQYNRTMRRLEKKLRTLRKN